MEGKDWLIILILAALAVIFTIDDATGIGLLANPAEIFITGLTGYILTKLKEG